MKLSIGYLLGSNSKGGLEMNQVRNAQWMQERGHHVVLFCQKGSPSGQMALEAGIHVEYIKKHRKYYDFAKGKELASSLLKHSITHLIVRATQDMSVAVIAKRALKGKIHLSYFMEMQLGVRKTNPLHTFRFRNFDLWSCPLNWLENQVHSMTNFPKNRTVVIPSGLDLTQFLNLPEQMESRRLLDLPEKLKLFGLIGRFDPQKGQLLLLEAMSMVDRADFGIVLLGEPTLHEGDGYFEKMKQLISNNDLNDRVFIRPFRKDIETFYNAVDWFVMASKAETFGMVTIESMACGTPTLGSNAGGTPELLHNGEMGVLFHSMDAKDLSLKMKEILEGKHILPKEILIQEAKRFDKDLVCEQVEKVLSKIN